MARKKTNSEFIQGCLSMHGDKYDYSLVEYTGSHNSIKVKCNEHGVFTQRASHHLSGQGCPDCNKLKKSQDYTKSEEDYINQAKEVHGDHYGYDRVKYVSMRDTIKVYCKIHRKYFIQLASNHIQGKGCPDCGEYKMKNSHQGWSYSQWKESGEKSKHFDSFKVYIIRCWNEDEEFFKIGKTYRTVKKRFSRLKSKGYNYKIIKEIRGSARMISELELYLHNQNINNKYTPLHTFDGMSECYSKTV